MVVVFVGFLAAYREPASLEPVVAGVVGALVVAWATFVPSFLWIFLGAPRSNASAATSGSARSPPSRPPWSG